ncbi:MAG TPA: LLM class F420-dependent oxidoreductase [Anaerolineales bacterium]
MKFGVVYPQTEIGNDLAAIRDYAQTTEGLGFNHVLAYDHVLGANPDRPEGFKGPYTYQSSFHEPFVLFSYMAGFTQLLEFTTGIIILPQRQTALVAKQAATLDVLSAGRLRLGVGLGWNKIEYIALGENFHNRGRRIEEQVSLMRELWTQPLAQFDGRWHTIPDAGINPLPVQQPIPVWFGGQADPVLERTARVGDGWMPNLRSPDQAVTYVEKLRTYLAKAGRENVDFGIEARMLYGSGDPRDWENIIQAWKQLGATHISINTMGHGFDNPAAHMDALRCFADAVGLG